MLSGFALGVLNILLTQRVLARFDFDPSVPNLDVKDFKKVVLIVSGVIEEHGVGERWRGMRRREV